jgi:ribosomal protein S18 acetylase RimI-like enzyme
VTELLRRLDGYLDAMPRAASRAESVGPLTLFVNESVGWRYYARPTPGVSEVTPGDVERARARQRELAQPEALEWLLELTPSMGPAAAATGMRILEHPLMVLEPDHAKALGPPPGVEIRAVGTADDLALPQAIAMTAFAHPGTAVGPQAREAVAEELFRVPPGTAEFLGDRIQRGLTAVAMAFSEGEAVAVGSHQPVGAVTEVAGVGVLPAYRRRGIGAALTSFLMEDAAARGVETVFLSAGDATIGRVYERLGFHTVGRAGAAELMED